MIISICTEIAFDQKQDTSMTKTPDRLSRIKEEKKKQKTNPYLMVKD